MADEDTKEATTSTETTDPVAELQNQLEAAEKKVEQHFSSWQRSAADFANFKRRVDEEKKFAERWLIADLLPTLDDFERAWASAPRELRGLTWLEGLWQVNQKLLYTLERHGVVPIESTGKPFNPVEHEAVLRDEEIDTSEQTTVVAELQRGYRLHERVLRATLVKVGRAPEPEPAVETEPPGSV